LWRPRGHPSGTLSRTFGDARRAGGDRGGWPRRVDKRGRRHGLAGGGLLLIRLDIVKAPHPGWVCVLGGGLRRPLLCLRFLSLSFHRMKFTVQVEILSSERNKEKLSGLYSIEFVGISRGKFQDRCALRADPTIPIRPEICAILPKRGIFAATCRETPC